MNPYLTNFELLLRGKTRIINVPSVIEYCERKSYFELFKPIEVPPTIQPEDLLICSNPFPVSGIICSTLKPYFECLSKTYKIRTNIIYVDYKITPIRTTYIPNNHNVITFLSMGKESLWNLSKVIANKKYNKIVVVYVNNCSPVSHYRQKIKLEEFKKYIKDQEIDGRVVFEEVKYDPSMIGIQKLETNIQINSTNIKEPLFKMQYCQMLSIPIIVHHCCGLFIIPMDYNEKNFNDKSHFSDQPISFISFLPYFRALLGDIITLKFNGLNTTRQDKVKQLLKINWLQFNTSCYQAWNWFDYFRTRNDSEYDEMCGSCFKCKIDIEIYRNLNLMK